MMIDKANFKTFISDITSDQKFEFLQNLKSLVTVLFHRIKLILTRIAFKKLVTAL